MLCWRPLLIFGPLPRFWPRISLASCHLASWSLVAHKTSRAGKGRSSYGKFLLTKGDIAWQWINHLICLLPSHTRTPLGEDENFHPPFMNLLWLFFCKKQSARSLHSKKVAKWIVLSMKAGEENDSLVLLWVKVLAGPFLIPEFLLSIT